MKKEDLFDAIGNADADLLARSEKTTEKSGRKHRAAVWLAATVPLAIVGVLAGVLILSSVTKDGRATSMTFRTLQSAADETEISWRDELLRDIQSKQASFVYPLPEEYDSLDQLLGEDYGELTVTELAQRLVPWVKENRSAVKPVIRNAIRGYVLREDGSIETDAFVLGDGNSAGLTAAASLQDAVNQIEGKQEDPVIWTDAFSGQKTIMADAWEYVLSELEIQCEWDISYSYHVADPEVLTVAERDSLLAKMNGAIETYLMLQDDAAFLFTDKEHLMFALDGIAEKNSGDEITFAFDESLVFYERTVYGGNIVTLAPDFDTVTVELPSGETAEITADRMKAKIYQVLKMDGIYYAGEPDAVVEGYEDEESRASLLKFRIDDVECELFGAYLNIGTKRYVILNSTENNRAQKIKETLENAGA